MTKTKTKTKRYKAKKYGEVTVTTGRDISRRYLFKGTTPKGRIVICSDALKRMGMSPTCRKARIRLYHGDHHKGHLISLGRSPYRIDRYSRVGNNRPRGAIYLETMSSLSRLLPNWVGVKQFRIVIDELE